MTSSPIADLNSESDAAAIGYLVIHLDPKDLPRGTASQDDVIELLGGLQDVIEGLIRSESQDDRELTTFVESCRFVILHTSSGSLDIVITIQQILALIGAAGLHDLTDVTTYETLILTAMTTATVVTTTAVTRRSLRKLSELYEFIGSVAHGQWDKARANWHEKVTSGMKRVEQVSGRTAYNQSPVAIVPNGDKAASLQLDNDAIGNIRQFIGGPRSGALIRFFGKVTALDRDNKNFRVSVRGYGRRFECRYADPLSQQVQIEALPDSWVIVTGIPHFDSAGSGALPPHYVQVKSVTHTASDPGWQVQEQDATGAFKPLRSQPTLTHIPSLWDDIRVS